MQREAADSATVGEFDCNRRPRQRTGPASLSDQLRYGEDRTLSLGGKLIRDSLSVLAPTELARSRGLYSVPLKVYLFGLAAEKRWDSKEIEFVASS
jgi:hypothetical protein